MPRRSRRGGQDWCRGTTTTTVVLVVVLAFLATIGDFQQGFVDARFHTQRSAAALAIRTKEKHNALLAGQKRSGLTAPNTDRVVSSKDVQVTYFTDSPDLLFEFKVNNESTGITMLWSYADPDEVCFDLR